MHPNMTCGESQSKIPWQPIQYVETTNLEGLFVIIKHVETMYVYTKCYG